MEKFNDEVQKIPGLASISEKTNLPAGIFVVAAIAISVVLVTFNFSFGHVLVQVIGVVYPAFKSVQALETDSTVEDDRQWLTYWFIFGLFNILDSTIGFILQCIPFYQLIKLLILIWLQNPITMGAHVIYTDYLQKYSSKYHK